MSKVILVSSDGVKFEVDQVVAKKSQLLKNMIEDTGTDEEIFLPNVKKNTLERIIAYCNHYRSSEPKEIEKPLPKNSLVDLVDEWDVQFIDIKDQQQILELILAANYLDIKSVLELGCAKIATMIKGKTAEEIRKTFGIVNDFTPQQESQIREQNKWAQESTL